MKVILSKDVPNLGRAGQIKEVSDGHARNFLIPRHLALPASSQTLIRVQKEEAEREAKIAREEARAHDLKNKLTGKVFKLSGKAEGQRLFAAIHEQEIANAINAKMHLNLDPKQVIIKQAIKTLGTTEVEIKLNNSTHAKVKIEIEKQG